MNKLAICIIGAIATISNFNANASPTSSNFGGYIEVREGAYLFYTFYPSTADRVNAPLILWLQGGTFASSIVMGNFKGIGPVDFEGKPRNSTWLSKAHLLFVDAPVGVGFSNAETSSRLPNDYAQFGKDLVAFMHQFYTANSEYKSVPLHIFGEGHSAKIAANLAYGLLENREHKAPTSLNLFSPWIAPRHSVEAWTSHLQALGKLNDAQAKTINSEIIKVTAFIDQGKWRDASLQALKTVRAIEVATAHCGYYNINDKRSEEEFNATREMENLTVVMNSQLKDIPLKNTYGMQHKPMLLKLSNEFLKDADNVLLLLNDTDVKVNLINGKLGWICPTEGNEHWLEDAKWSKKYSYTQATRSSIFIEDNFEGYEQHGENLAMYWLENAGQIAYNDKPKVVHYILKNIIGV